MIFLSLLAFLSSLKQHFKNLAAVTGSFQDTLSLKAVKIIIHMHVSTELHHFDWKNISVNHQFRYVAVTIDTATSRPERLPSCSTKKNPVSSHHLVYNFIIRSFR